MMVYASLRVTFPPVVATDKTAKMCVNRQAAYPGTETTDNVKKFAI
jgi:hypothetical protein